MKSTGIIKRVDDLGKVQIPKELRRLLNIGVGELMQFFTPCFAIRDRTRAAALKDLLDGAIIFGTVSHKYLV